MRKKLIIAGIASFVFFILLTSTYSIFKSNGFGNASLRAASWNVSIIGNEENINLTSGSTEQAYLLTVKNDSEVSVSYKIKITNLPDGVKAKLDTDDYIEEENNEIIFDNDKELLINGIKERNHTLTFTAPLDAAEIDNQKIKIDVIFKQKIS